jgi:ribonuclease P protein component
MKKIFRLSLKRDFKNVFTKGKFVNSPGITLKFYPNQLTHPRLAIIISKKVAKSAVKRNQLKRRIKEILHKKLNLKSGYDLIFITKPELIEKTFTELNELIEKILIKSNLF